MICISCDLRAKVAPYFDIHCAKIAESRTRGSSGRGRTASGTAVQPIGVQQTTRCKTFALWRGVAPPPPSNLPAVAAPLEVAVEASLSPLPAFRLTSGLERPILAGAEKPGMVEPADALDPASQERSLEGVESLRRWRCRILTTNRFRRP